MGNDDMYLVVYPILLVFVAIYLFGFATRPWRRRYALTVLFDPLSSIEKRMAAVLLLGRIGNESTVEHLGRASYDDPSPDVRTQAMLAIEYIRVRQEVVRSYRRWGG